MEATATRDPTLRAFPAVLLREPLFWAASAAFIGGAVGLVGTSAQASMQASVNIPYTPSMYTVLFAEAAQLSGEALVMLSLLGVGALLRAGLQTSWNTLGTKSRESSCRASFAKPCPILLLCPYCW